MKFHTAISLFLTGNTFLAIASPTIVTRQAATLAIIVNSTSNVSDSIFSMEKAVRSFSCDPRPFFIAQGQSHEAFRDAIKNINAAPNLTLAESASSELESSFKSIYDRTEGFVNALDTMKSALIDYGFNPFILTQLTEQRLSMIELIRAYGSRVPPEVPELGSLWNALALERLAVFFHQFKQNGEDLSKPPGQCLAWKSPFA
jgi:hypothetical protein